LIAYYVLIAGAVITLWRSSLIDHLERGMTFAAIAAAVLLGGVLGLLSRR
jgi:hypothetical protein